MRAHAVTHAVTHARTQYGLFNVAYTEIGRKSALQTREYKHNEYNTRPVNG